MAKQPVGNKSNKKFKSQKAQSLKTIKKQAAKKDKKKSSVRDARQNISQKKKKTVMDAREILAKRAKTQDARNKINNIRDVRTGTGRPNAGSKIKIIGNIVQKTDRNGKISLVTNKAKKVDMNLAIRKQLGLVPNSPPSRRAAPKRNAAVNTGRSPPVSIRKTILNEMDYPPAAVRLYDPAMYKWSNPELKVSAASQMINSLETTRQAMREALREEFSNGWPTYASHSSFQKMAGIYHKAPLRSSQSIVRPPRLQAPSSYVDLGMEEDEEMPMAAPAASRSTMTLQGTARSSNVHSRLDGSPQRESHGIFSHAKVVVPAGHRIVVSNLQATVTQDDIKELFEDIGQLLAAKLVRPGVAEVIYKNLKDAQKAVDTYHNRQLDGQPMKCLLVNKRPLNYPTALPIPKSETNSASRTLPAVPPCPPSNKLVPDITTIHKVLFHRK